MNSKTDFSWEIYAACAVAVFVAAVILGIEPFFLLAPPERRSLATDAGGLVATLVMVTVFGVGGMRRPVASLIGAVLASATLDFGSYSSEGVHLPPMFIPLVWVSWAQGVLAGLLLRSFQFARRVVGSRLKLIGVSQGEHRLAAYSGGAMDEEFSEEEFDRHNALAEEAWSLIEGEIILDNRDLGKPSWRSRRKLYRAVRLFRESLRINPLGWPSMWAIGKIKQRLDRQKGALLWFGRAHEINPDHPDVSREAALAAMELGEHALAVRYCRSAVAANPKDPGLVANLALALLLVGDVTKAREAIDWAASSAPEDPISQGLLSIINDVAEGRRPQPKTIRDVTGSDD